MEAIASKYLDKGATVFDIFSARDGESLAWCRSPYQDILLLCGDSVSLDTKYQWTKISDFTLAEGESHQLVVTTPQLYGSDYEQFAALSRLTDMLKMRAVWNKIDVLLVREASRLLRSRIISGKVKNQQEAEYDFIELHNESYHTGVAALIDSLRPMSIAPDVREVANYLMIKRIGRMRIPREMLYLYRFFKVGYLRNMPPGEFAMVTDSDNVAGGWFDKIPWHVKRGENLLLNLGIKVERDVEKAHKQEKQEIAIKKGKALEEVKVQESTPGGGQARKISRAIHAEIQELRSQELTGPAIKQQILAKHGIDLSPRVINLDIVAHRTGSCKCERA